jgi:hypothetical protein
MRRTWKGRGPGWDEPTAIAAISEQIRDESISRRCRAWADPSYRCRCGIPRGAAGCSLPVRPTLGSSRSRSRLAKSRGGYERRVCRPGPGRVTGTGRWCGRSCATLHTRGRRLMARRNRSNADSFCGRFATRTSSPGGPKAHAETSPPRNGSRFPFRPSCRRTPSRPHTSS